MKETGIVRRIDELGRIVIPKEIRKNLRIREGDPLEIYTEESAVIFKKYSSLSKIQEVANELAYAVSSETNCVCIITDTDEVIGAYGKRTKEYLGAKISKELGNVIHDRKTYIADYRSSMKVIPIANFEDEISSLVVIPVISNGDVYGCIALFEREGMRMEEKELSLVRMGAQYLGKRLE